MTSSTTDEDESKQKMKGRQIALDFLGRDLKTVIFCTSIISILSTYRIRGYVWSWMTLIVILTLNLTNKIYIVSGAELFFPFIFPILSSRQKIKMGEKKMIKVFIHHKLFNIIVSLVSDDIANLSGISQQRLLFAFKNAHHLFDVSPQTILTNKRNTGYYSIILHHHDYYGDRFLPFSVLKTSILIVRPWWVAIHELLLGE